MPRNDPPVGGRGSGGPGGHHADGGGLKRGAAGEEAALDPELGIAERHPCSAVGGPTGRRGRRRPAARRPYSPQPGAAELVEVDGKRRAA